LKKVITYGTFDLFHIGHLNILRRAKALGDYLVVAVSTDEFNTGKHKQCVYPYSHRAQIVEAIRYVDKVIPETSWEQKISDIKEYSIGVFVIGHDWAGKFDFLREHCEVVYLPRTKSISTTSIINTVQNGRSFSG
jgi:glycerol-3-phosphate cytidylyltransferase